MLLSPHLASSRLARFRHTFLNWDADASGEMSKEEVMGALRMLKLNVTDAEANALVEYYDLEGDGEMRYQPLVEDVTKAAPHFLDHPNTERLRREEQESARSILSEKKKEMPRICELFLKKVREGERASYIWLAVHFLTALISVATTAAPEKFEEDHEGEGGNGIQHFEG